VYYCEIVETGTRGRPWFARSLSLGAGAARGVAVGPACPVSKGTGLESTSRRRQESVYVFDVLKRDENGNRLSTRKLPSAC